MRQCDGGRRRWVPEVTKLRLTKYSHACLRLERDGAVLVVDPGSFSERAALDGVDAVLITHEHGDHLDVDKVADAIAARPSVTIHTNAAVAARLSQLGDVVRVVEPGDDFEAAGFGVRAYGGLHAVIHPDIPQVPNLGFLVENTVYHPGDSFDVPDGVEVDTLFVPVSAPWLKLAEAVDFVRAVKPRRAYALHDCLLADAAVELTSALMNRLGGVEYTRLAPGSQLTLG